MPLQLPKDSQHLTFKQVSTFYICTVLFLLKLRDDWFRPHLHGSGAVLICYKVVTVKCLYTTSQRNFSMDRRNKVLQICKNSVNGRLISYNYCYGSNVVRVQCKRGLRPCLWEENTSPAKSGADRRGKF